MNYDKNYDNDRYDSDRMEELMSGLAFNLLDEQDDGEARRLLENNPQAQELLAEYQKLAGTMALSITPVDLPDGSLERLRQKAGISVASLEAVAASRPVAVSREPVPFVRPTPGRTAARSRGGWSSLFGRPALAYAAAMVLFVTTMLFGGLWLSANNNLNASQTNQRALATLLSSPDLKTTQVKVVKDGMSGDIRLYLDPATDKAYLVAQNLTALPSDQEYEAWLIAADNQPKKAGLLGPGGNTNDPLVYQLTTNGEVEKYTLVAITVEKKGGVDKTDQKAVMVGNISA